MGRGQLIGEQESSIGSDECITAWKRASTPHAWRDAPAPQGRRADSIGAVLPVVNLFWTGGWDSTFRLMQFWGTYQGYRQSGPLTWQLRRTFYYPRAAAAAPDGRRPIDPIQYN